MAVFRVTIKGEGLRATFNGQEIPCGFFKNEFVWASNSEQAIDKARANVESALRRNSTVNQEALSSLQLKIEEVEAGLGIARLIERHGFVFHKIDGEKDTD